MTFGDYHGYVDGHICEAKAVICCASSPTAFPYDMTTLQRHHTGCDKVANQAHTGLSRQATL
jgi:hypothetical protein